MRIYVSATGMGLEEERPSAQKQEIPEAAAHAGLAGTLRSKQDLNR